MEIIGILFFDVSLFLANILGKIICFIAGLFPVLEDQCIWPQHDIADIVFYFYWPSVGIVALLYISLAYAVIKKLKSKN